MGLWIAGFVALLVDEPGEGDAEIVSHYADSANRRTDQLGFFLMVASLLLFVWFLTVLRARLAQSEGKAGTHTALAFGAGLVATALWFTASVLFMAVSYTAQETPEYEVDPNTERLVSEVGYLIFAIGTPVAALLVLATSLLGVKAGLVPKWLAWLGIPLAVLMIFAFLAVIPFLVFLVWVVAVSVALIARPAAR